MTDPSASFPVDLAARISNAITRIYNEPPQEYTGRELCHSILTKAAVPHFVDLGGLCIVAPGNAEKAQAAINDYIKTMP